MEDFTAMLDETLAADVAYEGNVVRGRIVSIEKDLAVIDVGLKMEGRVPLKEFSVAGKAPELNVGDEVEVDRVPLEYCRNCHGWWFDASELMHFTQSFEDI